MDYEQFQKLVAGHGHPYTELTYAEYTDLVARGLDIDALYAIEYNLHAGYSMDECLDALHQ